MNRLVNIKIYDITDINNLLVHIENIPVIDSLLILDTNKKLQNIFEELFESVKYEYCDYPRKFKMYVEILDIERKLPWNTITGFYEEYQVNDYDDIELISHNIDLRRH